MKLLVIFQLGGQRYGIDSDRVRRIIPVVKLRRIPQTPEFVAGVFNLQGGVVPVVDLCALALGRPCRRILSTRILLVDYPAADGRACALGMIAENVTETRTFDPGALQPPPLSVPDAPYLGPMLKDGEGVIQVVELSRLLPAALQETLFSEAGAVT